MQHRKIIAACAAMAAAPMLVTLAASPASAQPEAGPSCKVTVNRTQSDGVFAVTKQVMDKGGCICYVYTGSGAQEASVEGRINGILKSGQCPGANVVQVPGGTGGAVAGGNGILPIVAGSLVFLGGVALADGDSASP